MATDSSIGFRTLLCTLTTSNELQEINAAFSEQLLAYASATHDNVTALNRVEIGFVDQTEFDQKQRTFGLKLKSKPVLLSDLLYVLENEPMPKIIAETFPDLSEADWQAASRILYLMVSSFDAQSCLKTIC